VVKVEEIKAIAFLLLVKKEGRRISHMVAADHSLRQVVTSPSLRPVETSLFRRREAMGMGHSGLGFRQTTSQCRQETSLYLQATSRMDKGLPIAVNHPLMMVAEVRLDSIRPLPTDQMVDPAEVALALPRILRRTEVAGRRVSSLLRATVRAAAAAPEVMGRLDSNLLQMTDRMVAVGKDRRILPRAEAVGSRVSSRLPAMDRTEVEDKVLNLHLRPDPRVSQTNNLLLRTVQMEERTKA
jgi:hypothetical protein